jgi:hypothetical protein
MAAIEEDEQDQGTAIRTGQPKITVPVSLGLSVSAALGLGPAMVGAGGAR